MREANVWFGYLLGLPALVVNLTMAGAWVFRWLRLRAQAHAVHRAALDLRRRLEADGARAVEVEVVGPSDARPVLARPDGDGGVPYRSSDGAELRLRSTGARFRLRPDVPLRVEPAGGAPAPDVVFRDSDGQLRAPTGRDFWMMLRPPPPDGYREGSPTAAPGCGIYVAAPQDWPRCDHPPPPYGVLALLLPVISAIALLVGFGGPGAVIVVMISLGVAPALVYEMVVGWDPW